MGFFFFNSSFFLHRTTFTYRDYSKLMTILLQRRKPCNELVTILYNLKLPCFLYMY